MKMGRNHRDAESETACDELIDAAAIEIQACWESTRRGPFGKQQVLQSIYDAYRKWPTAQLDGIRARLGDRLNYRSPERYALLRLLIEVALPHVESQVANLWVDAIKYGEAHHVRPQKLRGFLYHRGGLVRCAQMFRENECPR